MNLNEFLFGALMWTATIFLIWSIIILVKDYEVKDANAACVGHRGVAQIMDTTYVSDKHGAYVVCKDGKVIGI